METAEQVAIPDPEVVPERTHSSKFSGKVLNIFQRTKIRELNPRQKKNITWIVIIKKLFQN
jgi:hypothetical protein